MAKKLDKFRARLAQDPHDTEALLALESHLLPKGDFEAVRQLTAQCCEALPLEERQPFWKALCERLESFAESNPERSARALLLSGQLHESELGLDDDALALYLKAYERDSDCEDAILAARALEERRRNWESLGRLIGLQIEHTEDPEARASLWFERAKSDQERGRESEAAQAVQEALKLCPNHPLAAEFKPMATLNEADELHFVEICEEAEKAHDPRQKASLLLDAAVFCQAHAPQDVRIRELCEQVLALDARNESARALLVSYLSDNGAFEELTELLVAQAEKAARKSDRLEIYHRLADVADLQMGQPVQAAQWHRKVLEIDPGDQLSLNYCIDFYKNAEQWRDLVAVYENALKARNRVEDEGEMLLQIATILWKKIGDLKAADGYFKRIKLNNPHHPTMLQFYVDYDTQKEDWQHLLTVLSSIQADSESVEEQIEIGVQMARVAEEKLQKPARATEIWKSILKLEPTHAEARDALRRLLYDTGKWNALLEFLKEDLTLVPDDAVEEKVRILERTISIYQEQFGLPKMVINTYNQILAIDPSNEKALEALQQKYEESSRWTDLIGILQRRSELAANAGNEEQYVLYQRKIADLYQQKLNNPNAAISCFEIILEHLPNDPDAIKKLTVLYRHFKDWRALYKIYERELPSLSGPELVSHLREMAQMATQRLDMPNEALGLWQRILDEDPTDEAAWLALESLYAKAERYEDLAVLYECREGQATQDDARLMWLKKLAAVYSERLKDEDRAADVWRKILTLRPGDLHAENYLRDLYLRRGDYDAVTELYERRKDYEGLVRLLAGLVAEADTDDLKVDLYRRMASLLSDTLNVRAGAVECWESILSLLPNDRDAAAQLAPIYRETGAYAELVHVLEILLDTESAKRFEIICELAQVQETGLKDWAASYRWSARALEMEPEDLNLLAQTRKRALEAHTSEAFVDLVTRLSDNRSQKTQVAMLHALAETCEETLSQPSDALTFYERLRAVEGETPENLAALDRLYSRLANYDALLDVRRCQLQHAESEPEKIELLLSIAELYETAKCDEEAARQTYLSLRAIDERNLDAAHGLQRLAELAEDWSTLCDEIELELSWTEDPAKQANLLFSLGQLAQKQGQSETAIKRFGETLEKDVHHAGAQAALEGYLEGEFRNAAAVTFEPFMRALGDDERLLRCLEIRADETEDVTQKCGIINEIAQLQETRLNDAAGAFESYERLLRLMPTDEEARGELERLAESGQAYQELADFYAELSFDGEYAPQDPELCAFYARNLAKIQENQLNDAESACETWQRICVESGDQMAYLDHLDRLKTRLSDAQGVVEVCERKLALLEASDDRREMLFRIARLWEEELSQPSMAVETYLRLLREFPENDRAIASLERIYTSEGRFDDLAALLEMRLANAEGSLYVDLSFQLAELLANQLDQPAMALERYAAVLERTHGHAEAENALEQLLSTHSGEDLESCHLRAGICDILEPLYTERNDWKGVIRLLQVRLGDESEKAERVTYRMRIAALYEQNSGDSDMPLICYGDAWNEDFGNANVLAELERVAAKNNAYGRLVQILRQGLDDEAIFAEADPEMRRSLLGRVAELYEHQLQNNEEAIAFNCRILDENPEDQAALETLDRLYTATDDAANLAAILERRGVLMSESDEQAALYFRLGDLYENRLGDLPHAIAAYAKIRSEIAPDRLEAHSALERLYAAMGEEESLVAVLLDHAAQVEDLDEKKRLLFQAAEAEEGPLANPEEAVRIYREILEIWPENTDALGRLDQLLVQLEQSSDLLDVLERELELAEDDEARNRFESRMAELLIAEGDLSRAVRCCEAVLNRDPLNAEARRLLESLLESPEVHLDAAHLLDPVYEMQEEWGLLRDLLHSTVDEISEADQQVAVLKRVAGIEENRLSDLSAAFQSLSQAYRISGADLELERELERLTAELGTHAELADLMSDMVGENAGRSVQMHMKIADLAEHQLDEPERAIEHLREVLAQEPESVPALDALVRLYEKTSEYRELIEVLERKLELGEGIEYRKPLYERIASLHEDFLNDPESAIEVWRRLLAEDEADLAALDHLERLLESQEQWSDLAALCEHRMSVETDDAARLGVEFCLARICETKLHDGARAIEIYKHILEQSPAHEPTCKALAALFEDEVAAETAGIERLTLAHLLEPIYRASEDDAHLVQVLDFIQQTMEDEPDDRLKLLAETAQKLESLDELQEAFEKRAQIFELNPLDKENRSHFVRLAERLNAFERLTALFTDVAANASDEQTQISVLLELGQIEESRCGHDDRARDVFREVLSIDSQNAEAIQALVALFSRLAAWEDLVSLYLDLSDSYEEPEKQVESLFKVAELLDDVVGDRDRAIEIYRKILEHDPSNARAFKTLERFFSESERYEELADLLRTEIEEQQDCGERAALRCLLAETLAGKLDQLEMAIDQWRLVLQEDDPQSDRALQALEHWVEELDAEHPCCLQASEVLEPIYAEHAAWAPWVKVSEIILLHQSDRWQRLELLLRIAKVWEQELGDKQAAFHAYARAFAEDYGNADLQVELDRLVVDLGAWQELVETYEAGLDDCSDDAVVVAISLKIAKLYHEHLNDVDRAIEFYRRVLQSDSANQQALDALEELFDGEGRHQELIEILDIKAEQSSEWKEKRSLISRVCKLWENVLFNEEEAISSWRRIVDESPEDLEALDSLARLYRQTEQWMPLIETLQAKLEILEALPEKKAIAFDMAEVWENKQGEIDEAIQTYRTVLEWDSRDEKALSELKRLFEANDRFNDWIDLLESERKEFPEDAARVDAIDQKMGEIYEQKMGDVLHAIEIYSSVLERNPRFEPAVQSLEHLAAEGDSRLAACRSLAIHYEKNDQPADWARILEMELDELSDPSERQANFDRIAELQQEKLNHLHDAFATYGRAFAEDPSRLQTIDALEQLSEKLCNYDELCKVWSDQIDQIHDVDLSRELARRMARIEEQKLQMSDNAIASWKRVLEADPFDKDALETLDRLYQAEQNWPALIDILQRRLQAGEQKNEQDLRFRLGYLLEVVEDKLSEAIELYRAVLWENPNHRYALEAMERLAVNMDHRREIAEILEPIYRDQGAYDKLCILTEMRIELSDDPAEKARLWGESAAIREEHLKDPYSALRSWLLALSEQPNDEEIRKSVWRLAQELNQWRRLRDVIASVQDRVESADLRLSDRLAMGQWSLDLSDPERAKDEFKAALEIDPASAVALDALEKLYESAGSWTELADIYRRKIDALFDMTEKQVRLHQLGELYVEKLNDSDAAINIYEEILSIDDRDAKAMAQLEKLHEQNEHWADLARVLERRCDAISDEAEQAAIYRRLAKLYRERLQQPQSAVEAWEHVLEQSPEDAEALDALESLLEETNDFNRLYEILQQKLKRAENDEERKRLLIKMGDLVETKLSLIDEAVEHLTQYRTLDPQNLEVMERLESLLEKGFRWDELVALLREHAEKVTDVVQLTKLRVQIATVAERELGDADLAIQTLNQVLETSPQHPEALAVLSKLYERNCEWDKAVDVLQKALAGASTKEDRAATERRLGLLYLRQLDRPEEGLEALRSAVAATGDAEALEALLSEAKKKSDWPEMTRLIGLRLKALEGAARVPMLLELAELNAKQGNEEERVRLLEEASKLSPKDTKISDALLDAWIAAGRLEEAEPLLERTIESLKGSRRVKELNAYQFRLGCLREKRGDDAGALKLFMACFESDATDVKLLLRLGKLHCRAENWADALKVLQTALLHQMKLDPESRVELFYHLGRARMATGDQRRAKDMFDRALRLKPDHEPTLKAREELK